VSDLDTQLASPETTRQVAEVRRWDPARLVCAAEAPENDLQVGDLPSLDLGSGWFQAETSGRVTLYRETGEGRLSLTILPAPVTQDLPTSLAIGNEFSECLVERALPGASQRIGLTNCPSGVYEMPAGEGVLRLELLPGELGRVVTSATGQGVVAVMTSSTQVSLDRLEQQAHAVIGQLLRAK
jgi:hypothetical protein